MIADVEHTSSNILLKPIRILNYPCGMCTGWLTTKRTSKIHFKVYEISGKHKERTDNKSTFVFFLLGLPISEHGQKKTQNISNMDN